MVKFDTIDLWFAPGPLLRRCHQRSRDLFNEVLGEFGLTRQQTAILIAIAQNPGNNVQNLSDATGCDRSTIADIMGRLLYAA